MISCAERLSLSASSTLRLAICRLTPRAGPSYTTLTWVGRSVVIYRTKDLNHVSQMAGESEVKAEVKLRFINTNGDRMVADRRLQVTKKKTTLSLKTLEGTISFDDGTDDTKVRLTISQTDPRQQLD